MADIIKKDGKDEMPPVDPNPVTETRIRQGDTLIIKRMRERPVEEVVVHDIARIQNDINRIDGVIALWQAKREPLQAIIDEYNGMEMGK